MAKKRKKRGKKHSKKRAKKSKGKVPLKILERRLGRLNGIVKSRGGAAY